MLTRTPRRTRPRVPNAEEGALLAVARMLEGDEDAMEDAADQTDDEGEQDTGGVGHGQLLTRTRPVSKHNDTNSGGGNP